MPLFRASLGTTESNIAIFESEDADSLLEKIKSEHKIPESQEWVRSPFDPDVWMIHDPELHEDAWGTANDENTTYLTVTQVVLGEWYDPDLD